MNLFRNFLERFTRATTSLCVFTLVAGCTAHNEFSSNQKPEAEKPKPNILWIVTDDQRADSIAVFNQLTKGRSDSDLGYVSSPNIDALASKGVTFSRAYTNSPACAPSRSSMLMGLYPHRSGRYGFEQTHNKHDLAHSPLPVLLKESGYQNAVFGKTGYRIFQWDNKLTWKSLGFYEQEFDNKRDLQNHGLTDFYRETVWKDGKVLGIRELFHFPDEPPAVHWLEKNGKRSATENPIDERLDILRAYTREQDRLIIGGVSSQPAGKTLDGYLLDEFKRYLSNSNQEYSAQNGRLMFGPKTDTPLMLSLGFHFPHTPVLPPKSFRDRFIGKHYKVPNFSPQELERMPAQLRKLYAKMRIDGLSEQHKQQAIADYYAFCAYGDALIGDAVEAFIQYSKDNQQEYLIVLTVGDHGWQLGEQGIEAKFAPWNTSNQGVIIVAGSDLDAFPSAQHYGGFVEYVDIVPTILSAAGIDLAETAPHLDGRDLAAVLRDPQQEREYVIGELNHVIGPRAYLRSDRFAFSMRIREEDGKPGNGYLPGDNIRWALTASNQALELALYDLQCDKNEQNNIAYSEAYREVTDYLKNKLANIILGDGRVEVDWSKPNSYFVSNFAEGAHDGRLANLQDIAPSCLDTY